MLPLDHVLAFDSRHDDEFFAAIPRQPGVICLELHAAETGQAEPYIARTADLHRTAERLLRPPDSSSRRLNLRNLASCCRFRITGSRLEQALTIWCHARELLPRRYGHLLRLRTPAMLKVNTRSAYPRCYVTRKILSSDGGFYVGPFPSRRIADEVSTRILDLFKVRRCQIRILRDPQFPGCIYSEMKMCLAPCFAGCTQEEYSSEVLRLTETLATRGDSLTRLLETQRDAASEGLEYERAAALQKRLEKVQEAFHGWPELARRMEDLNALILQAGPAENSVIVFPVQNGFFQQPVVMDFSAASGAARSAEEFLRTKIEFPASEAEKSGPLGPASLVCEGAIQPSGRSAPDPGEKAAIRRPAASLGENLALLARWYYSNPREGEIFFRENGWPYRRIMRACARVMSRNPGISSPPSQPLPPPA